MRPTLLLLLLKLRVPTSGGEMVLTYDPARISQADLKAAAELCPESGADSIAVGFIATCASDNPKCAAADDPTKPEFYKKVEPKLAEGRAEVAKAAARKVPPEMQPIAEWTRRFVAAHVRLEELKVAAYGTWYADELKPPIEGVDTATPCAEPLKKLAASKSIADKLQLIGFTWHNCANDALAKGIGEYPIAVWKRFLKTYGIRTKVVYEGD